MLALYGCRCRLARHSSAERGAIALPFAPAVYRSRGCPSLPLFFPASYSASGGLPPLPRAAWRILGARNRGGPDPTRGPAPGGTQGPTARIKRTPQHYAPATSLTPKTKQKVNRPNYTKCLFCTHGRKYLRPSATRRLGGGAPRSAGPCSWGAPDLPRGRAPTIQNPTFCTNSEKRFSLALCHKQLF